MNAQPIGDRVSVLGIGQGRTEFCSMLGESGVPFDCDWVDRGEAALSQDYHDLAVVHLGNRRFDPTAEPDRLELSMVSSMGIPAVVVGSRAALDSLRGLESGWDWTFVDEADLDSYELLSGMRNALNGYLEVADQPESCHRYAALHQIEDHFVGSMPWS